MNISNDSYFIVKRHKNIMSQRPVLHFWEASPAARICQLVIRYLKLDVEVF